MPITAEDRRQHVDFGTLTMADAKTLYRACQVAIDSGELDVTYLRTVVLKNSLALLIAVENGSSA